MQRLLRLFPMKPVGCACCRLRSDGRHVWNYRNCAACGAVLKIRRHYFWTTYVLALVISGGIAFAVGNRGTALSSLAVLLVLPTFWGMLMINLRLFPADIAPSGDRTSDRHGQTGQDPHRVAHSLLGRALPSMRQSFPAGGGNIVPPPPICLQETGSNSGVSRKLVKSASGGNCHRENALTPEVARHPSVRDRATFAFNSRRLMTRQFLDRPRRCPRIAKMRTELCRGM